MNTTPSSNNTVISKKHLPGIDALRMYAATSIILFHLTPIGQVKLPGWLGFIASHFGFGVPLFFVISGFSLAQGYSKNIWGVDEVSNYFLRRFFRIAPLFYLLLIVQLLLLHVLYGIHKPMETIIINATFVFNIIPGMNEGIVFASWSIGVEMIVYLLFPVLLAFFCANLPRSVLSLCIAVFVAWKFSAAAAAQGGNMPCSFVIFIPYFISGIIFNEIYMRVRDLRVAIGIGVAALCVGLISVFTLYHNQSLLMFFQVRGMRAVWDAFWGLPFGLLCLGIALAPIRIISNPITCYLGKISYGLYLWHPVILLILGRLGFYKYLAAGFSGSDSLVFLFSFLSTLCLDIILATISYRLVEKPGMGLQKHCKAIFSKFNFSN